MCSTVVGQCVTLSAVPVITRVYIITARVRGGTYPSYPKKFSNRDRNPLPFRWPWESPLEEPKKKTFDYSNRPPPATTSFIRSYYRGIGSCNVYHHDLPIKTHTYVRDGDTGSFDQNTVGVYWHTHHQIFFTIDFSIETKRRRFVMGLQEKDLWNVDHRIVVIRYAFFSLPDGMLHRPKRSRLTTDKIERQNWPNMPRSWHSCRHPAIYLFLLVNNYGI